MMHNLSDKKGPFLCRLSLLVVLLSAVIVLTLLVETGKTGAFDAFFIGMVQFNKSRALQVLMQGLTALGTEYGVIVLLIMISAWLWRRRAYPELLMYLGIALAGFVTEVSVKILVHRARPVSWLGLTADGYSYPSGHAIMTFILAAGLVLVLRRLGMSRWWKTAILLCLAAGVGISRVYLGVHWPTDVLGSWLMGSVIISTKRWS